MEKEIAKLISKYLTKKKIKISIEDIQKKIEIPPSIEMGDYAFPCFFLASLLKIPPNEIAIEIRKEIPDQKEFENIETRGPYINFFLKRTKQAINYLKEIQTWKNKEKNNKTMLIDFSSPNIAKPFGVGHLRSTLIGNAIANLYEEEGYKVIRFNYLGDWGTQFGKLIYGYIKWGDSKKLKKDPIQHMFDLYVKVSKDEKNEVYAREWFKKLEDKDPQAVELWQSFKEMSVKEFNKIYSMLGIKFDEFGGESFAEETIPEALKILEEKKLLVESEGAKVVDLKKFDLGVCLIKKSDEATTYALRDIASAIARQRKYAFDEMIYETGQEQILHFKQVFKVLELMGFKWSKNCKHIYHGLYLNKEGKKFSTRRGETFMMEDLLEETKEIAVKEIKKREAKISKKELERRAEKIVLSAIFYGDLKSSPQNNVVFDLERFVSFEGDTGPYILYTCARANSILKKCKNKGSQEEPEEIDAKEFELIKKMKQLPQIISKSYLELNPAFIANYSFQLAQIFNEFYHEFEVIGSDKEKFRIEILKSFLIVMKKSLTILGIDILEKM